MAFENVQDGEAPLVLLLAASDDRASSRWLARWEAGFEVSQRVPLGPWDNCIPDHWLNRLNLAITAADRPVVLVTRGLACLAVAWWVEDQPRARSATVRGAVFHEPPVLDIGPCERSTQRMTYPAVTMPFPTCLLANGERGYAELNGLRRLARRWDCHFDTMAGDAVSQPKSFKSVQSLGERFLAQVMNAEFSMRPTATRAGYPFSPARTLTRRRRRQGLP